MTAIKHISGDSGGYLVGNSHSDGGIKAINKAIGKPIEMEGGEVVITKKAVDDPELRDFNGEMLTNKQILSKINESGGGISFAELGAQLPTEIYCSGQEYKFGGKTLTDYQITHEIAQCGCNHDKFENGGIPESDFWKSTIGEKLKSDADFLVVLQYQKQNNQPSGYDINLIKSAFYNKVKKLDNSNIILDYITSETEKLNLKPIFTSNHKIWENYTKDKVYDLIATWAGGVLVISDKNQKQNGDYKTIAHIRNNSEIKYFEESLPSYVKDYAESFLKNSNVEIKQYSISDYKNPYEINRAIETLLDSIDENQYFTENQKQFIRHYSGYGGLEKYGSFSDNELKGLLYEYFTPDEIVKKMWALAYKYGFGIIQNPFILEPSVGTGNFLKYAPIDGKVYGNEINPYSKRICEILYPDASISLQPFEKNFISKNLTLKSKIQDLQKYDLVIGNPPYGHATSKYIAMGEGDYTKARTYTEYFITRSLDLLKSGGLLIFIVGAEQYNGGTLFLDSGVSDVKIEISNKSELVDAYRLPTKVFERTGVASEILVFKKK